VKGLTFQGGAALLSFVGKQLRFDAGRGGYYILERR
jgi:hypothetical protein